MDAANTYAYKGLLIEVEINQDYIEVSHVVYLPTLLKSSGYEESVFWLIRYYDRNSDRRK